MGKRDQIERTFSRNLIIEIFNTFLFIFCSIEVQEPQ